MKEIRPEETGEYEAKAGRGRKSKAEQYAELVSSQPDTVFVLDIGGDISRTTLYKVMRSLETVFYLNAVDPDTGDEVVLVSISPFERAKEYTYTPKEQ